MIRLSEKAARRFLEQVNTMERRLGIELSELSFDGAAVAKRLTHLRKRCESSPTPAATRPVPTSPVPPTRPPAPRSALQPVKLTRHQALHVLTAFGIGAGHFIGVPDADVIRAAEEEISNQLDREANRNQLSIRERAHLEIRRGILDRKLKELDLTL